MQLELLLLLGDVNEVAHLDPPFTAIRQGQISF
jgi:hypothetical protein